MPKLRERKVEEPPREKLCNTYGEIIGINVGAVWSTRAELSHSGIHRRPMSKIHPGPEGAYSLLLTSGKEALDDGNVIFYFGKAALSNATLEGVQSLVKSEKSKLPVRIVRSHKVKNHYAPQAGYRYDGLYTVVECWLREFVDSSEYRFKLVRLGDQAEPPWKELESNDKDSEPHIVISRHIRIQGVSRAGTKPKEEPSSPELPTAEKKGKTENRDTEEEDGEEADEERSEEEADQEELVEMGEIIVLSETHDTSTEENEMNVLEEKIFRKGWDGCCEFVDCAEKRRLSRLRKKILAKPKQEANRAESSDSVKEIEDAPEQVDPFGDTLTESCTAQHLPIIGRTVSFAGEGEDMLHQEYDSGKALAYNSNAFRQVLVKPILLGTPPQIQYVTMLGQTEQIVYQNCIQSVQVFEEEAGSGENPPGIVSLAGGAEGIDTPGPSQSDCDPARVSSAVDIDQEEEAPPRDSDEEDIEIVTAEDEVKVCFDKKFNLTFRPHQLHAGDPSQAGDSSMLDMSLRELLRMLKGNAERSRSGESDAARTGLGSLLSIMDREAEHVCCACVGRREIATGTSCEAATQCEPVEVPAEETVEEEPAPPTRKRRGTKRRGGKRNRAEEAATTAAAPIELVKVELDPNRVLVLSCPEEFQSYPEEWARPHIYQIPSSSKSFDQICEELCDNIPDNASKSKMKVLSTAHEDNHLCLKKSKQLKKKRRRKLPQEGFNGFSQREATRARVTSARHYGKLLEYSDFHGWPLEDPPNSYYLATGRVGFE